MTIGLLESYLFLQRFLKVDNYCFPNYSAYKEWPIKSWGFLTAKSKAIVSLWHYLWLRDSFFLFIFNDTRTWIDDSKVKHNALYKGDGAKIVACHYILVKH